VADPRYRTNADRVEHAAELDAIIGGFIAGRTQDENVAFFEQAEVTIGPIYDTAQILEDPHFIERELLAEYPDDEMGGFPMQHVVPRLFGTSGLDPRAGAEARRAQPGAARSRPGHVRRVRAGRRRRGRRSEAGRGRMKEMPVWRSLLYVPVNVEKYVEKAHTRGADCIQLDLEDSVPAAGKARARTLVADAAGRVRRGGADVVVRINSPLENALQDLDCCICADVDGIAITKTENASYVQRIDDAISRLEAKRGLPERHTRLIAMVETPAAFFDMPSIARASARLAAMNIGARTSRSPPAWSPPKKPCSCRSSR
jgi:hypothetical protein